MKNLIVQISRRYSEELENGYYSLDPRNVRVQSKQFLAPLELELVAGGGGGQAVGQTIANQSLNDECSSLDSYIIDASASHLDRC
jgi:hypothetical protein